MLIIEGYNDTKIKTQSISIDIINEEINSYQGFVFDSHFQEFFLSQCIL